MPTARWGGQAFRAEKICGLDAVIISQSPLRPRPLINQKKARKHNNEPLHQMNRLRSAYQKKPGISVSEARGHTISNHRLLSICTTVRCSHCVSLVFESPPVEMAQMRR